MKGTSPIREIRGIGTKTEQLFHKMGVYTVGDILLHFPRDYVRMPKAVGVEELLENMDSEEGTWEGTTAAVLARIDTAPVVRTAGRMAVTSLQLGKGTKKLSLIWFRMPYLRSTLSPGTCHVFYGKLTRKGHNICMEQPQILSVEKYESMQERLWPSYPLTKGLSRNTVLKIVSAALEQIDPEEDQLPEEMRCRLHLMKKGDAIRAIHFPDTEEQLLLARRRLVFDEFFQFILASRLQKRSMEQIRNPFRFCPVKDSYADQVLKTLPYELTDAQKRTLGEVREGLRGPVIMQRLIQGDVGSGKTILAFLAMLDCAQSGYQSALMAPTEVLARQHYENFCRMCRVYHLSIPVLLLTGSLTAKEKRSVLEEMASQQNAMVIGTHALIQERSVFSNLALVITDEQHRFGVNQREKLSQKGLTPHILVMSATPIPRTLAMILYGDLDISVIDQVPARRLPIKNCVVTASSRPASYRFIRKEVENGHQAYVICPLVEESEGLEAQNVTDYAKKLKQELPDVTVECLHGRMKGVQKNRIMEEFASGQIKVLVSTTVIEVGVNVPNATVMMIEDAQRYGLAQLHQLRGRVGRGEAQSYCILINTDKKKEKNQRLEVLNHSNDGFFIASEDLKLRGPGDFFGIRQSGSITFHLGDIYRDSDLLKIANDEAESLLDVDPELSEPAHAALRVNILSYLAEYAQTANL